MNDTATAEIKESGICGANVKWTVSQNGVLTVEGTGEITEEIKPDSEVNTLVIEDGITGIGDEAFASCTELTSVELPDTLTTIGSKAFANCTQVKSIELPDTITEIAEDAFEGWVDGQEIESSWYHGVPVYWYEWYQFWRTFGTHWAELDAGVDLDESTQVEILDWWQYWIKNGTYWRDHLPTGAISPDTPHSWWEYWLQFGNYLPSLDEGEDGDTEGNTNIDPSGAIPYWWHWQYWQANWHQHWQLFNNYWASHNGSEGSDTEGDGSDTDTEDSSESVPYWSYWQHQHQYWQQYWQHHDEYWKQHGESNGN